MQAVIVLMNGWPAGIIGLARGPYGTYMFSEYRDVLQPHLKSVIIMRAVKTVMQMVEDYHGTVYTVAQEDEGKRLVQRLGFSETTDKDVFVWLGHN